MSRGTPGYTQSRNAWVYTVAERVDLHISGTRGFTQYAERVGYHSRGTRGTRGFTQSRNAWIYSRGTAG